MTTHRKEEAVPPTLLPISRANDLRRADRDGWSRNWPYGAPHYFHRGQAYALCGSGASYSYPLNMQDTPDGDRTGNDRKTACPHCDKLLKAGRGGLGR